MFGGVVLAMTLAGTYLLVNRFTGNRGSAEAGPGRLTDQPATVPSTERATPAPTPQTPVGCGFEPLSDRELEVLQLLATGRSNREIATELYVATGTVKAHLNHIFRKLEAHSRLQAVTRARDLRLITEGKPESTP